MSVFDKMRRFDKAVTEHMAEALFMGQQEQ